MRSPFFFAWLVGLLLVLVLVALFAFFLQARQRVVVAFKLGRTKEGQQGTSNLPLNPP